MKSFHLKYGWQLIQTTIPTTTRNELQNHEYYRSPQKQMLRIFLVASRYRHRGIAES